MNTVLQACTLPLEHVAAFFDAVLGYYQVAAIALTSWTLLAWAFVWVLPHDKNIPYWLGTNVVWASSGTEAYRRSPPRWEDVGGMLLVGFLPYLNVLVLALLVMGNVFFIYQVFCLQRRYSQPCR